MHRRETKKKKKIKSEGGNDTREYRQTKRLRSRRPLPVGCKGCERIRRINIPPPLLLLLTSSFPYLPPVLLIWDEITSPTAIAQQQDKYNLKSSWDMG